MSRGNITEMINDHYRLVQLYQLSIITPTTGLPDLFPAFDAVDHSTLMAYV